MWKYPKLVLPLMLVAFCLMGLMTPTKGQVADNEVWLNGPSEVTVCDNFEVELSVVHRFDSLGSLMATVTFDPNQMEARYDRISTLEGWQVIPSMQTFGSWYIWVEATRDEYIQASGEDEYVIVTLVFHCLAHGKSTIDFEYARLYDGSGQEFGPIEMYGDEITQVLSSPVGGVMTSVNKFTVLAPYLGLVGLAATVTLAAAIMRRQRD